MKITPEIIVKNPDEISQGFQDFANNILMLIQKRVLDNSKIHKEIDANLYVYIGLNVSINSELLTPTNDYFYYGADDSMRIIPATDSLISTIRNALKNHVKVIDEIKKYFVFLSLSPIDKKNLTGEIGKNEQSVMYHSTDPVFTLDEVVMNQDERNSIMRAISLVKEKDLIYNKWNFKQVDKHQWFVKI